MGVVVNTAELPVDPDDFAARLDASIVEWREAGYEVAWVDIPIGLASHVPIAVQRGFGYHHADEDGITATLTLIPGSFIPPYATHYVGAGGVVVNGKDELLVVCERYRIDNRPPFYKLPGGALEPGENIVDSIVREVFEETGIEAEFQALTCFRHWHGYRYGKSDIYYRMPPESADRADQDGRKRNRGMPLDAGQGLHGGRRHQPVQQGHRSLRPGERRVVVPADMPGMPHDPTREYFLPNFVK